MQTAPIKFQSIKEAAAYFDSLGFDVWDSFKLASALWTQQWGVNKALEEEKAVADMRAEFPGMFNAAAKYNASGSAQSDQEVDQTGTDLDQTAPPVFVRNTELEAAFADQAAAVIGQEPPANPTKGEG